VITLSIPRTIDFAGGMDWGFNGPGVILWAAMLPSGAMHVVREWKYHELEDNDIASGFHERTKDLGVTVRYVAGDWSMWIRDGRSKNRGQSRAETLIRAGMPLRKAENARVDGWARMHSWLKVPKADDGTPTGPPLLTIDVSCTYLRRTIPAQRSSKADADDVDTTGDDHGVDALRYLLMSRPSPTVLRAKEHRYHPDLEAMIAGSVSGAVLGSDAVMKR
jgi:hypothetical protein